MSLLAWVTGAWKPGAWRAGAWKPAGGGLVRSPWRTITVVPEMRATVIATDTRTAFSKS